MNYLRELKKISYAGALCVVLLSSCESMHKKEEEEPEECVVEEVDSQDEEIYPQEIVRSELSECPIY